MYRIDAVRIARINLLLTVLVRISEMLAMTRKMMMGSEIIDGINITPFP